jgi:hypothetical protein
VTGIIYYVSGHGYGHAVRSALVVAAIQKLAPDVPLWIRTTAPPWLFPVGTHVEPVSLDLGVLQRGSLYIRPEETLRQYSELIQGEPETVQAEVLMARERRASCIVGDIPSAAFEIAHRVGIPAIAVANFCWHWIYEPYAQRSPQFAHVVDHIRQQESLATVLLRLRFAWEFDCFHTIEDVPLIGRKARHSRDEVRGRLGIAPNERVALLSFGGYGLEQLGGEALHQWRDWVFLTTDNRMTAGREANILNLIQSPFAYEDILASSDAVVTKPGFGIVSDALVNHVPVLYGDRGNFREYAALSRGLRSYGRALHISRQALASGELGLPLEKLTAMNKPWRPIAYDGAEVIGRRVLEIAYG